MMHWSSTYKSGQELKLPLGVELILHDIGSLAGYFATFLVSRIAIYTRRNQTARGTFR